MALYQSRTRKEQAAIGEQDQTSDNVRPPNPGASETDLTQINKQTRQLLLTAVVVSGLVSLWFIWVDVFPALSFLDQVPLWSKTVTTATQSGTEVATVERIEPVTAFDLLMAVLLFAITFVIVRDLPGFFQLLMLERLPLTASLRFTIITITRYLLVLLAILLIGDLLGVAWSKVQWLVAALMIGLGFGLQEIFANFVSGLILLIERPIRVGDLVTVGKINGEVAKIQLRATTIRDWNKRELVVPNKQLVTDKLINWSLSDSIYRVDMDVGIVYGSDTELARKMLLEILNEHPKTLPKPTPKAIFKKFGDSALVFELRFCIPHMDFWPRVLTEVHQAIYTKFREAGIVFAFPQQDVHIRTIPEPKPGEDDILRRMQDLQS